MGIPHLILCFSAFSVPRAQDFEAIFNGEDLSGWEGDERFWSVRDGAIVGKTTAENPCEHNTFLVWRSGELKDFFLLMQFRIHGGNSGVQFRSTEIEPFVVKGYQSDLEDGPNWSGGLYEERGRGILVRRGQEVSCNASGELQVQELASGEELQKKVIRAHEWNELGIVARGDELMIAINGTTTGIFHDAQSLSTRSGILALQLHAGPPMEVEFKDLRLLRLEASVERPFELQANERVALVGGSFFENADRYGTLEIALRRQWPDRSITVRNFGWSADTVEGKSRAYFGSDADGFANLVAEVQRMQPTTIFVCYGTAEALENRTDSVALQQAFVKLLAALELFEARIVVLLPPPLESLGDPLPDMTLANLRLSWISRGMQCVAQARSHRVVELHGQGPLTEDGVRISEYGYYALACELPTGAKAWSLHVSARTGAVRSSGTTCRNAQVTERSMRLELLDEALPLPRPKDHPTALRQILVDGLEPGTYRLSIDGQEVLVASAEDWNRGQALKRGPEFDQAQALQSAVVEKNELFFESWRPQNQTYLFGFRKHEQGEHAAEVPEFLPLVAEKEREIDRLLKPVAHRYELQRLVEELP